MSILQSEQSSKNFSDELPSNIKIKSSAHSNNYRRSLDIQEESDFNIFGNLSIVHTMLVNLIALFAKHKIF